MPNLTAEQKSIKVLFQDKKSIFLIPDFQRPYAWEENECQKLWDDLWEFAFPDNDTKSFNESSEYYLGSIIAYRNNSKFEIIDGQQRITTLMLLLRALLPKFNKPKDDDSIKRKLDLKSCISVKDKTKNSEKKEFRIPRLESEVILENSNSELKDLLSSDTDEYNGKSLYAKNYKIFCDNIKKFNEDFSGYIGTLVDRILDNCIILFITTDDYDSALRIFSTLNDRGMPLSDADIFKSQMYKFYKDNGNKDTFIKEWNQIVKKCNEIFTQQKNTPMDGLFTRYMYYERAKKGEKNSSTGSLRKFYERDNYILLKNEVTFKNLKDLTTFWEGVYKSNFTNISDKFDERILRQFKILNYAPNGMWTYLISVYFLSNKKEDGSLDNDKFYKFLKKIIAFIWMYAILNPGVNYLRKPLYPAMIELVNGKVPDFSNYKFQEKDIKSLKEFSFKNMSPVTKSFLAWWAFKDDEQTLISSTEFDIEHIIARRKGKIKQIPEDVIDKLGNKSLLEKNINIRASDLEFNEKIKEYQKTEIQDLRKLCQKPTRDNIDFFNADNKYLIKTIQRRTNLILDTFIKYLKSENLLK